MPLDLSHYLPLNPFVDTSVKEDQVWGQSSWLDVSSVHGESFRTLTSAIQTACETGESQVRFVRGIGGSGKSHLFARLRRENADSLLYAYLSNPPLQNGFLESFILSGLIGSLQRRGRNREGVESPFSQLRQLAYAFLQPVVEQGYDIPALHHAWEHHSATDKSMLVAEAIRLLKDEHRAVQERLIRCLLYTLLDDKEVLAAQWLSGSAYLTEEDLQMLGVTEPLSREHFAEVICLLGKLARQAGVPFILALDQLDLVSGHEYIQEFQKLLFDLLLKSANWVVFIALTPENFDEWNRNINHALRTRIGVLDGGADFGYRLQVADVLALEKNDQLALLRSRLNSPKLEERRRHDRIASPSFPLEEADLQALTRGGSIFPRPLLATASESFRKKLGGGGSVTPLEAAVDRLIEQTIGELGSKIEPPLAVELGERVREVVRLLSPKHVSETAGNLRTRYAKFDGMDMWLECEGQKVRLISSHAAGTSFPAVLKRLLEERNPVALIRYAGVQVSGQATRNLLDQLVGQTNQFHLVVAEEWRTLSALGRLLASVREGNFIALRTEPPPKEVHLMECLRQNPRISGLKIWEVLRGMLFAPVPGTSPPQPTSDDKATVDGMGPSVGNGKKTQAPNTPPPEPSVLQAAMGILASERWLEVRRLHRRLELQHGCRDSLASVCAMLHLPEIASRVSLYPKTMPEDESKIQIVVWHEN